MAEWISVENRLPDADVEVLLCRMDAVNDYAHPYCYTDAVEKGFCSKDRCWYFADWDLIQDMVKDKQWSTDEILEHYQLEGVTHWQPLPEPPQTVEDSGG